MKLIWSLAALSFGVGSAITHGVIAKENEFLSLKEVPIPVPTAAVIDVDQKNPEANPIPGPGTPLDFKDLVSAGIVKDQTALVRLGKALFWDTQVGSDGVQACASCHFHAGADRRSKNQVSPGLNDSDFTAKDAIDLVGDKSFGNSVVPYTAHDPNTPNPPGPSEPPPVKLNVPGILHLKPNYQLTFNDFPLNDWFRPTERTPRGHNTHFLDEFANVRRDTNDVISSQGVRRKEFTAVKAGDSVDDGKDLPDIFNLKTPGTPGLDSRVRRVPGRNAPTVINAVFNFDNFWDGRASFIFNGVNPFGFRDRHSTLKQNKSGTLQDVFLRITNSSLASQAVGPVNSDFEMAWVNRTFPDVGKKMLSLRPLAKQLVHPEDSVLGGLALAGMDKKSGQAAGKPGLNVTNYAEMIKAAFQDHWWNSEEMIAPEAKDVVKMKASINNHRTMIESMGRGLLRGNAKRGAVTPNQYTQMQWNFSLFFGLAVQAYEATLVSDDTPFDRFQGAPSKNIAGDSKALTDGQRNGLAIFMNADSNTGGHCNNCHSAPITTNHSINDIEPDSQGRPRDILEFMVMGDGSSASYDKGFYNIGVRRTTEDIARAGTAPLVPDKPQFSNPKDGNKPFPLSYVELAELATSDRLPPDVLRFVQTDPNTNKPVPVLGRHAIHGSFKAPNLRNVRFTGPYFHNGDSATLRHVAEFYTRGGNFPNTNLRDLDPDIEGIPSLRYPEFSPSAERNMHDLVDFVANGLTDDRVAREQAPFDHPSINVPNGVSAKDPAEDDFLAVPAVGKSGHVQPLPSFLDLDPQHGGVKTLEPVDKRVASPISKEKKS